MGRYFSVLLLFFAPFMHAQVAATINSQTATLTGVDPAGAAAAAQAASTPLLTPILLPQFEYLLDNTVDTGATVTDTSGNGFTGTLINPTCRTTQGISMIDQTAVNCAVQAPAAAFTSIGLYVFCAKFGQSGSASGTPGYSYLLNSDSGAIQSKLYPNAMGQATWESASNGRGNANFYQSIDKLTGEHCVEMVTNLAGGTNMQQYIDGKPPTDYIFANPWPTGALGTTNLFIGGANSAASQAPSWTLHYAAAWPSTVTLTPAIIMREDQYIKAKLEPRGIRFNSGQDFHVASVVGVAGDSMTMNAGNNYAINGTSISIAVTAVNPALDIIPVGQSGSGYAKITGATGSFESGLLHYYNEHTAGKMYSFLNTGTNDINAARSASSTYGGTEGFCDWMATNMPGSPCVLQTIAARCTLSNVSAKETQRGLYNTQILSDWLAGLHNITYVVDVDDATLGRPGNTTTIGAYPTCTNGGLWYVDGTHWTNQAQQLVGAKYAIALSAVTNHNPTWAKVMTIPYTDLLDTAATSGTFKIKQLGPREHECGTRITVTTAFTGTSITALTLSTGASSPGTTTQFSNALSLTATGTQYTGDTNFSTLGLIHQFTVIATGGNLNAMTAGSVDVEACYFTPQ